MQAAGHGGQVLLSQATSTSLRALPPQAWLQDLGAHRLKGVGEEHLWQLCHPNLRREFPPLSTLSPERHNLPPLSTPLVGREEQGTPERALRLSSASGVLFGAAGSPLQRYPNEMTARLAPLVPGAPMAAWRQGWEYLPLDELIASALAST